MTTKERLLQFVETLDVSDRVFESSVSLSNGSLRKVKNFSGETLAEICRVYPTLSAEWLLRGIGDMLLHESQSAHMTADRSLDEISLQKLIDERIAAALSEKKKHA